MKLVHVGLDDTDSKLGGCTTFAGYSLLKRLTARGHIVVDYPRLVRLNPNVPWKTRGNAAVGLSVLSTDPAEVFWLSAAIVAETRRKYGSRGSVVMVEDEHQPRLRQVYDAAIHSLVDGSWVQHTLEKAKALWHTTRTVSLAGAAAAAAGLLLEGDHTFELIAYRKSDRVGLERQVDAASVKKMDEKFRQETFSNVDGDKVLITPHGMDPVLYGIRGESPDVLLEAARTLCTEEPSGWCVFRTNQGTDVHYRRARLSESSLGDSLRLDGVVDTLPVVARGGNVFVDIRQDDAKITAAFYRETGDMRDAASKLFPGDRVELCGGLKPALDPTLNVEKMSLLELVPFYREYLPKCLLCDSTLESMGRGQGFRCRRCGRRYPTVRKERLSMPRDLGGRMFFPPLRYFRHLMKPPSRLGREKEGWRFLTNRFTSYQ